MTIPNSTLANEPITNWSEMGKRRVSFTIGLSYSTSQEKVETCARKIEKLLRAHEDVDQDLIMVRFNELNDSSLDIFVYFFTKTIAWTEWFRIKEHVNFEIMKILEEENVSIAFPTRRIYLGNEERKETDVIVGQEN